MNIKKKKGKYKPLMSILLLPMLFQATEKKEPR